MSDSPVQFRRSKRTTVSTSAPPFEFIAKSLRQCPAFSALADSEIAALAATSVTARIRPGEVIYRRGDPAAGFYLIVAGSVRLVAGSDPVGSAPRPDQAVGPRACFGDLEVLEDVPRAATAVAADELTVVAFDRGDFELLLIQNPRLVEHILESLEAHTGSIGTSGGDGRG